VFRSIGDSKARRIGASLVGRQSGVGANAAPIGPFAAAVPPGWKFSAYLIFDFDPFVFPSPQTSGWFPRFQSADVLRRVDRAPWYTCRNSLLVWCTLPMAVLAHREANNVRRN
jgi:hypothetical protein